MSPFWVATLSEHPPTSVFSRFLSVWSRSMSIMAKEELTREIMAGFGG